MNRATIQSLMIVDDHAETRRLLRELLCHLAIDVCECASGEEAVERCEEIRPDFVIMDMNMQQMNGLEAARQILRLVPQAEVVIVTSSDAGVLRRAAIRAGVGGCYSKEDLSALKRHIADRPLLLG